jgi:arylsulfatase A-like enzyme
MHFRLRTALGVLALTLVPLVSSAQQTPPPKVKQVPPQDPVVLPRPDFHYRGNVGRTITESDPPEFPAPQKAPPGAPNVVLILIDDAGFGQWGTFGGQTPTPGLDRVAREGLRYNTFHTTALCSPTRAALLTGRNHHSAGTGTITEAATGYDGYTGIIPRETGTVAEVLRQNGYATSWFGKNHNTPEWETSQVGPFDRWPSGLGFDYFYGFMGGDMDQWHPTLYENHNLVPMSDDPNYLLTPDLVDHAIRWLRQLRSLSPDKPYFLYMAPGATHAPHHAGPEWIAKFKGQFDQGWDAYRQQTFERQKRLGVIPADAKLTPRPAELPAWESLSADQKRLFSRMMEVFAAFTAQTDHEMNRLLDVVRSMPDADNTMIIYEIGDNGSSAEGGLVGLLNENSFFNAVPETLSVNLTHIDELGGPKHFNHFPAGWAWAMDTPFQWTKQIASHFGGTRNPLVISWPKRIRDQGGVRSQFHHVIDLAPTIYEAAGIRAPDVLNGVAQKPIEGVSMAYSFDSAAAPGHRRTQYFELGGTRGIYSDGWFASSRTVVPWVSIRATPDLDTVRWELYHTSEDFTQATDLAQQDPRKLRQLQDLWWAEAARYQVLPMDTRAVERLNGEMQGRPSLTAGRTTFTYYPGTLAVPSGSAPSVLNKSFSVDADLVIPRGTVNGAVWAIGGTDGGYGIYIRNGKPLVASNFLGRRVYRVEGARALTPGAHKLRLEFTYDGGGLGKGGVLALFVDGQKGGETRITQTLAFALGISGAMDVGQDSGTPVDDAIRPPFPFNGTINSVTVTLKPGR